MNSIADIRKDYRLKMLSEEDTAPNALDQFKKWWDEAVASEIGEVNAMTLATANKAGYPSARIVLLKGLDENGFIFFTNYESRKGAELKENPEAALVFFWKELERQIRIEGTISKLDERQSDEYFYSRPQESQIGAWSSPQSKVIKSRDELDKNVKASSDKFSGIKIERPPFWGGYILNPVMIEFWQGRSNRLHDRVQYIFENDRWLKRRLAP